MQPCRILKLYILKNSSFYNALNGKFTVGARTPHAARSVLTDFQLQTASFGCTNDSKFAEIRELKQEISDTLQGFDENIIFLFRRFYGEVRRTHVASKVRREMSRFAAIFYTVIPQFIPGVKRERERGGEELMKHFGARSRNAFVMQMRKEAARLHWTCKKCL